MPTYKLSIVIPVYNGAKTVAPLCGQLISSFREHPLQIVLINDGSQDHSHEACLALVAKYPAVMTYLALAKNFGEHNAVMAGLNHVSGDYAVIMDDDAQNPPEEVHKLFEAAQSGDYDVVYSYYSRKEHGFWRNLGSQFNDRVANFMLDKPRGLYLSSFKCLSRFVINEIIRYKGPFPYIDGLALRCTRKIGRVETKHEKRKEGASGYTPKKLIKLWLNMFVNFSINPLRVSSVLGLICSGLGLALGVGIIFEKIMHPDLPTGWASLMIIVIFFAGIQLLTLGMIGEYLGRLFMGSNQTPQFVIREVHSPHTSNIASDGKNRISDAVQL